jgi:inosine-uridine nucleoside N-ribohydrolase
MATTADIGAQAARVTNEHRVRLLSAEPAAPARMVLDTDAWNEIDDQFAVAIGAPTNVASALLADPGLAERIVVVWLGGHALNWGTAEEFNLRQDPAASRVLLDSGVPLVLVPCNGVTDRLITTKGEIDRHVRPAGGIGALLAGLYDDYVPDVPGHSKVIWDLAATAWVLHRDWLEAEFTTSPILTSDLTWSRDPQRHLILSVTQVGRDQIFWDLFRRLAQHS